MRKRTAGPRRMVGRAIVVVTNVVVVLIVLGILLVVLEANPSNVIVSVVTDVAETLVGPFREIFTFEDRKSEVAVNWGLAALVYAIVGRLLASLVAR